MKKLLLPCLLALSVQMIGAQAPVDSTKKKNRIWRDNHYLDISMTGGEDLFMSSLQWDKLFGVAWRQRVKVGFGIRVNMANCWNYDLQTAFYNRPSGQQFDTLVVPQQTSFSVNLTFAAELSLFKWLDIGLNEDLVGASWGETTTGTAFSSTHTAPVTTQNVRPATLNAFLFGRNDRGSLNSQFYLRFWPSNDFFIKAGFSIVHLTQRIDDQLPYGSVYFMARNAGFISLGWTPGRNEWNKKKTSK